MTQSPKLYRFAVRLLPAIFIIGMWLALFWPMLCGSAIAGYRDSTYLYYPMFQWIDWQMQQGEFPLWMPYENTGFPLLADGTSSLLYPGKAIFLLRSISFPARYGWYLALHILLAAAGSYWMAKTLGANRWGATLAAISYAFGGSVLFQVCNVVYLVSAAWLPWALTCVWKMTRDSAGVGPAIAASVCCSMMILGGDPQMVYHVGLVALMTATVAGTSSHRGARWLEAPATNWARRLGHLVLLVVATSALSAVQLLPTIEWSGYSDRANTDVAMSIYDGDFEALVNLPDQPPVSDVYQFSQEPWSVLGLLFPNVFGLDAPVNTRWSAALPGAERIWVPSNYFGCLVFLLALTGFLFHVGKRAGQGRAARVWLTWIAIWFGVASFGWYGASWLMTECGWHIGEPENGTFNQPVGGLYWLMVTVLPKYCLFRYPAKLMVVGCLAMSVLAGLQLRPRGIARLIRFSWATIVMGILGVVILFLPQTTTFLMGCHTTTLFGPFQFERSWYSILFAFLCTTVSCGLLVCAFMFGSRNKTQTSTFRWLLVGLVVLTMVELGFNNKWMLHPIDSAAFTALTETERGIENLRSQRSESDLAVSVLDTDFENQNFFGDVSENRIAELALWRREMLFPKTHLMVSDLRIWGGFTSIWPAAFNEISSQSVAAAADAAIVNSNGLGELKPFPAHPHDQRPKVTSQWNGQKLQLTVMPSGDAKTDTDLELPILPMPGWEAHFLPNSRADEILVCDILPAGPLTSTVSVPAGIAGKSFEIHCIYRPASFFWGRLISCCGWMAVGAVVIFKWLKPNHG